VSTLENRPNSALLVVDVQNGVVDGAHERMRPGASCPSSPRLTPNQVIAHTNLYWSYQKAPGRAAGTVVTKDVDFSGASAGLCQPN
jgi:nicotinamidase-related amidase